MALLFFVAAGHTVGLAGRGKAFRGRTGDAGRFGSGMGQTALFSVFWEYGSIFAIQPRTTEIKTPDGVFSSGGSTKNGANDRNRTDDLLITSELLYRLSYIGVS